MTENTTNIASELVDLEAGLEGFYASLCRGELAVKNVLYFILMPDRTLDVIPWFGSNWLRLSLSWGNPSVIFRETLSLMVHNPH